MSELSSGEREGAAVYSKAFLTIYDLYVLQFSNRFIWHCPTDTLKKLYVDNVTDDHLEIGPGTGWYLVHAGLTSDSRVTLVDLNPNSLAQSEKRVQNSTDAVVAGTYEASILSPLSLAGHGAFRSVAANFVFHCIPGDGWKDKAPAIGHIAATLHRDGVFFGSTILGNGEPHTRFAKRVLKFYNEKVHSFHNSQDDLAGLERALTEHFEDVELTYQGSVAKWRAAKPRASQ